MSVNQLAEYFGVDRKTIERDLEELEDDQVPIRRTEYGYTIDPEYSLRHLRLNTAESMVLYLAARRVARQSTHAVPPMVNALDKLSAVLGKPIMQNLRDTVSHIRDLPPNREKQTVFERLVHGWSEYIAVQIGYRPLRALHTQSYLIYPYLFEPSPWGEGTYVIGWSEQHRSLATFKLERIERATLSVQRFAPLESIDHDALLRHTWGIWMGDGDPVAIVLRFNPNAARRLRENRWHPTEELRDLPMGGVEWRAEIDEPQEMMPWIRGWGADVEVIAPESLREELVAETRRLARLYGVQQETSEEDEYGLDDIQEHES
jgi:CRISPR-associated endonuclease/helicase Cas3